MQQIQLPMTKAIKHIYCNISDLGNPNKQLFKQDVQTPDNKPSKAMFDKLVNALISRNGVAYTSELRSDTGMTSSSIFIITAWLALEGVITKHKQYTSRKHHSLVTMVGEYTYKPRKEKG